MEGGRNYRGGFITTIIVIIAAIIILKFVFDVDIIDLLTSPRVTEWLNYVKSVFVFLWEEVIHPAITFIINIIKGGGK